MMLSMPGGFFSEPVGVPIYDFFFEGGQICRIIEWTWTIKNSDKMLNFYRPGRIGTYVHLSTTIKKTLHYCIAGLRLRTH